jgi:hypothetical protein
VLVVALALLVLAATVMVGISRAAIRHTAAARDAHADLQRRYGSISIRAAILPRAESILVNTEAVQKQTVPTTRGQLQLGGFTFNLILSDEQAKANLNRLIQRSDAQSVETRLRGALTGSGLGRAVRVRPAPILSDKTVPFRGIGQVFDLTDTAPARLLNGNRFGGAPLDLVTLWGDGRVNLRRASVASARLALAPPLSSVDVDRLLAGAVERQTPGPGEATDPLVRLLAKVNVPYSIAGESVGVSLGSSCHSLWVITSDGRREWCELEVLDRTDPQRPISSYFAW